ncbi:hypothetical protein MMC17_000525 [Xylographa soralifera]|nr:hypothetical protein [Xylographa soralifera]
MVFYIRFLKVPKISPSNAASEYSVKTTITITSDLGEEFLAQDVELFADLDCNGITHTPTHRPKWRAGMRALPIEFRVNKKDIVGPLRLCISGHRPTAADQLSATRMPELVSAWSGFFGASSSPEAPRNIERRFDLNVIGCAELFIWEETGESIARHIWDASLGLVAHLRVLLQPEPGPATSSPLRNLLHTPRSTPLHVLELGTGCGIAGLALAQMRPEAHVMLTDLPQAMDILSLNIAAARLANGSHVEHLPLDWDAELPTSVRERRFELVLVSDCTYNADSLPALVKTLGAVVREEKEVGEERVLMLVAMKVRHESEKVFFELMADARFVQVEHWSVSLPDKLRSSQERSLDVVEIYAFGRLGKGG